MVDIVSEAQRSYNMSRIRSKDTKPELCVRSMLHRLGYRFTVNGPKNKQLPGKPDIVLPKYSTVIFVHGCFWHGHEGCKHATIPKTRTDWWRIKICGNVERDRRNQYKLSTLGWKIVVIWECELKSVEKKKELESKVVSMLAGPKDQD